MKDRLLDLYGDGCVYAYSLERLKTGQDYSFLVRRSTDNTELYVPFDKDGYINMREINKFKRSRDILYLVKLIDQSGNRKHIQWETVSEQPRIRKIRKNYMITDEIRIRL